MPKSVILIMFIYFNSIVHSIVYYVQAGRISLILTCTTLSVKRIKAILLFVIMY
jgi:hypothetical protein